MMTATKATIISTTSTLLVFATSINGLSELFYLFDDAVLSRSSGVLGHNPWVHWSLVVIIGLVLVGALYTNSIWNNKQSIIKSVQGSDNIVELSTYEFKKIDQWNALFNVRTSMFHDLMGVRSLLALITLSTIGVFSFISFSKAGFVVLFPDTATIQYCTSTPNWTNCKFYLAAADLKHSGMWVFSLLISLFLIRLNHYQKDIVKTYRLNVLTYSWQDDKTPPF
jgi:hypothetical protein